MKLWTLELTHEDVIHPQTELRGIFTSYEKARDAINVRGYWTTYVNEYGNSWAGFDFEPFYKDEYGNKWHIYETIVDILLPSDWGDYA